MKICIHGKSQFCVWWYFQEKQIIQCDIRVQVQMSVCSSGMTLLWNDRVLRTAVDRDGENLDSGDIMIFCLENKIWMLTVLVHGEQKDVVGLTIYRLSTSPWTMDNLKSQDPQIQHFRSILTSTCCWDVEFADHSVWRLELSMFITTT